jgi:2-desacetyl-2-hydroxyethyl bacteriochlorophyllide A dehydrogenase
MKSAVLTSPLTIQLEERPIPTPGHGERLVRVGYVGICGTDLALFSSQERNQARPFVPGHELSGRLVDEHTGEPGEWVALAPLLNCRSCEDCRSGRENLCASRRLFGVGSDGGLQEYILAPLDRLAPLPEGISPIEGALVEPTAVAVHACRMAGGAPGEQALVLGSGAVGLLIAQVWRALGREVLGIVDLEESRLAVAEREGFKAISVPPAVPGRPSVLFEATGSAKAFAAWLPHVDTLGRAVIVGKLVEPVEIDWVSLLRKEASIRTSRFFTMDDFFTAVDLIKNGLVNLKSLIGGVIPFMELQEDQGRKAMAKAQGVIRLVVEV